MANDPYNRSWKKTSLSILWLLAITLTTFFAIFFYEKGIPHDEGKLNDLERLVQGFYFQLGVRVYLGETSVVNRRILRDSARLFSTLCSRCRLRCHEKSTRPSLSCVLWTNFAAWAILVLFSRQFTQNLDKHMVL